MNQWSNKEGFFEDGEKLKILVMPANNGGCSFYRAINPYKKLQALYPDVVDLKIELNPLQWEFSEEGQLLNAEDNLELFEWCDIFFTQGISNFTGKYTARVVGKAKELGKIVHYDTDDLLTNLYEGHRLKAVYDSGLSDLTKHIYNCSDIVSVTQEGFAEQIKPYVGCALAVIKNSIDYTLPSWQLPREENKKICRIGWVAGIHHEEDVKEFAGVPNLVNQKARPERVFWGFYGRPPVDPEKGPDFQQEVWENYQRTLLRGFKRARNWGIFAALPPTHYGMMYSKMDVSIAPLQDNSFNRAKSDIKISECGQYKIPLVASDVGCYNETIVNGETGYLIPPDAPKREWVKVLTHLVKNPKLVRKMGNNLYDITKEYFDLNKVVHHRLDLYKEFYAVMEKRVEAAS